MMWHKGHFCNRQPCFVMMLGDFAVKVLYLNKINYIKHLFELKKHLLLQLRETLKFKVQNMNNCFFPKLVALHENVHNHTDIMMHNIKT